MLKSFEIKDAEFKYGFKHKGVFALESIKKGDIIYKCHPDTCVYLPSYVEASKGLTREELKKLCDDNEDYVRDYIDKFNYMIDDDSFDIPKDWKEQNLTDACMYLNHSCSGNCGFVHDNVTIIIAIRDIEEGEELTFDYQLFITEYTLHDGIQCKCGSTNCRGVLRFDVYRNVDWIKKNYKYASYLVQKRIDELQTKWFSSSSYLIRYDGTNLCLMAWKKIDKHELVAIYSDSKSINPSNHYIRHDAVNPTLYLSDDGEVYARDVIEPGVELTLDFTNL